MLKTIFSLHKLEGLLSKKVFEKPTLEKSIASFYLADKSNPKYIKPTFSSEEKEGIKLGKLPKVILISAAGATGKSEMTKYLSATLGMPIFDLALHAPVASNSLTGLFFDTLGAPGLAKYIQELERGNASMIVDALDEGHLKTTVPAFESFLDGIISIASKAEGTPFILFGRSNIVDHCALYLWENKITAEVIHIEPFTIEQAKEFIDKRLSDLTLNQQYKIVRDYIIESVEGFFRNESEIARSESQAFIGYAPVLLSISVLLSKTQNFKALHEDLSAKNDRGVELILDIMSLILNRDRDNKILPILNEGLLVGRDPAFIVEINKKAYSSEEQCLRILCHALSEKPMIHLCDDIGFNQNYEELATEWLKEHPFIQNGKIQNTVFESFVIAKLIGSPDYSEVVQRYLKTKYRNAFMLFFIFDKLSQDRKVHPSFLPYLFSSLKSLDDKQISYGMDIYSANEDAEEIHTEAIVEFFNNQDQNENFEFTTTIESGSSLTFNAQLSNVDIALPTTVELKGKRIELGSPISINCSSIKVATAEFVVECKNEGDILLECEEFSIDYSTGQVPQIIDYGNGKTNFYIICSKKPEHPFATYFQETGFSNGTISEPTLDKYTRLRKILMQFRSHSKGELAKLKDKVEHPRILKNDIGWAVLNKLTKSGVIFTDAHLYKINAEELNMHLGLSYLDLKRKIVNAKTIEFLEREE